MSQDGIRAIVKATAKTILSKALSLPAQTRLARALIHNVATNSSDLSGLERLFAMGELAQVALEDRIRQLKLSGQTISSARRNPLRAYVMEDDAPWKSAVPPRIAMPGMITDEETQYYDYITQAYEGRGKVIELGPWLGHSTRHIVHGLSKNPNFADRKLHVFDDFVWRSLWMDPWTPENERLSNHADFRPLFEKYVRDELPRLSVTRARIADFDGNEAVPQIAWDKSPIEMIFVDCGRTIQANEGWFQIFSPSFLPDVTLLVMQDWRLHRERPRVFYNQTDLFTAAHPELRLVHEVQDGGLATFLFQP